jgi:hypothetical protein
MTGFAIVAAFMPFYCMAAVHERWLGMGPLPNAPIVEYLARSTSVFYALHGVLMFIVSTDLRRFAPILSFIVYSGILCGAGLLFMDCSIGMPRSWTIGEGPFVMAISLVMLALKKKAGV